jgi:hypothetical protein
MPSSSPAKTMPRRRGVLLAFLLGIAIMSPLLLPATSVRWLPAWSVAALLGVLCLLWRTGELRVGLLLLFVAALMLAASTGWLTARAAQVDRRLPNLNAGGTTEIHAMRIATPATNLLLCGANTDARFTT